MPLTRPSTGFVVVFLLFSLLFLRKTYMLWFKTDEYHQDIYNSLTHESSIYPFWQFFLEGMESKQRWVLWQKGFSLPGLVAVITSDVLVVMSFSN
jgi:hypothetical protein